MSFSTTLLYREFTHPLTQNMPSFTKVHISSHQNMSFFKGSSTENSQIFPHKPLLSKTLPQNIHIISHKACLFNNSHLQTSLSSSHPKHVFLHAFFHKGSHILSPKHAFFKGSSTRSSHTSHALFHSKTLPQKIHTSSHPTCLFTCLRSMKQRQHI